MSEKKGARPGDVHRALLDRLDPELVAAADEVDVSLLRWSLALSPFERLEACTNAGRALSGFRRVPPKAS